MATCLSPANVANANQMILTVQLGLWKHRITRYEQEEQEKEDFVGSNNVQ